MNYLRLKKNTDFQKLFNRGKRVFSPAITMLYIPSDRTRMGIAVSKKHGKATKRNRIKRLVRAAFSCACVKLNGNFAVVLLPRVAESYSYSAFLKSLEICIKKMGARAAD